MERIAVDTDGATIRLSRSELGLVIPFVAPPKPMAPIEPLGETEQLELFAA
jgi:hypothetical protein